MWKNVFPVHLNKLRQIYDQWDTKTPILRSRSELVPLRGNRYCTKSTLCNVKFDPSLSGKNYGRSEVLYAVNRWAYFSCGTAMHWTEEKRASWEIFSDGAKLWHTTVGEFEYWSKYFQHLNLPPISFPWRFVFVQGVHTEVLGFFPSNVHSIVPILFFFCLFSS